MAGSSPEPLDCPGDEALSSVLDADAPEVEEHLEVCEKCRARLDQIAGDTVFARNLAPSTNSKALDRVMSHLARRPLNMESELIRWLEATDAPGFLGRIGSYQVRRLIAEGGMGIVLEGHDPVLDREVAIKLIKPQHASGGIARERMLREARAVAGIEHASIVPIYTAEIHEKSGAPYFAMPLVKRGTLQDRLDESDGPLPFEEVVSIGGQIAQGLGAAHAKNVLHRDIKPANILLRDNDEVWVADFGIARASDDQRLTGDRERPGTPLFMAPEQIDGRTVDHRADLFSLGAVLYLIATGKPAFSGDSEIAVIRAVADRDHVPAQKANPALPRSLAQLIDSLLEKEPSRRPQSAAEVAAAMETVGSRQSGERNAVSVRRVWLVAAVAAVLFAAGVLAYQFRPDPAWKKLDFVLPGQRVGFESLDDAIAAVDPGGVVLVRKGGVIHIGPLVTVEKPITIRAAEGVKPGIVCTSGEQPMLEAKAPVVLEGLRFVTRRGEAGTLPPIVRTESLFVALNCGFSRGGQMEARSSHGAILSMVDDGQVHLTNCSLLSSNSRLVGFNTISGQFAAYNCLMAGPSGLTISNSTKGAASLSARIRIERSLFAGPEFIRWRSDPSEIPVDISILETGMDTSNSVFAFPRSTTLSEIKQAVSYHGERNLYQSSLRGYFGFGNQRRDSSPGKERMTDLGSWLEFWGSGDGSGSVAGDLKIRAGIRDFIRQPDQFDLEKLNLGLVNESFQDRGVIYEIGGPGTGFDHFRSTKAYSSWQDRVAALRKTATRSR